MQKRNLLHDQLDYFDKQLRMSFISLFTLSLLIAYLFSEHAGVQTTLYWLGVNTAVIVLRLLISSNYKKQIKASKPIDLKLYYWLFFFGVFLTSCVWAFGTFLFFVSGSHADQTVLTVIYAGITSGAVISLSVRKEYFFVYLSVFLSPLIYLFGIEQDATVQTMTIIVVLYGLFLLSVSDKYSQMINNGIKIRYENEELIESLKKAKEATESASKSKSEFLANMSHEIRTPMTGILGFVEQLAGSESDPGKLKQFEVIKNSGHTLLAIINDILDLSKIESGKMALEVRPVDIHKLFDETIALFHENTKEKNLSLKKVFSSQLPECIMLDELRYKQILFNLISNAIKFTPSEGNITIEVYFDTKSSSLYCAVVDNGIGIAEEDIKKIFHAFGQKDTSTTRRYGGTGLGLTISTKLVEMMDGKLKLESTVGKGSKFYFDVPTQVCPEDILLDRGKLELKEENSKALFNAHVLVVEDLEFNQMLLGSILDKYGVTYDTANDGIEAVGLFKENSYDAIFMDENMPNMNGIEATRQILHIEAQQKRTHTPIIAVTANALSEDRKRFLDAGMDDYMSKPYLEKDVVEILRDYLI